MKLKATEEGSVEEVNTDRKGVGVSKERASIARVHLGRGEDGPQTKFGVWVLIWCDGQFYVSI